MTKPEGSGGLWGGRFREGMAPAMVRLNESLPVDVRLWREDIRGSQAWARGLGRAGILTADESRTLVEGLAAVAERLRGGAAEGAEDEDIHSLVERLLREEVGEVAGKLHTGRSRNDQVATDFRLWGMEAARGLRAALGEAVEGLLTLAERGVDRILPGYTHLQQAQPIRAAHWALSHAWPLLRDRERLARVVESAAILPLGSGAIAGCPFPVDREALREDLGFRALSLNSVDAVADRDWAAELAFTGALLGVHLSRLGEDLVLFSTREFSHVRLSDGYSTGSSLLPQKRNPDAAELVRGKTGRLVGNLTAFLTLLKGLPTGYNRDLQEDKEILFDTVDTLFLVLPALAGALGTASFPTPPAGGASGGLSWELLATDLADHLVRRGVPFREAHGAVGRVVRAAEDLGVELPELPPEVLRGIHPAFQEDVSGVFSWETSVELRATAGGTARAAVMEQMEAVRRALGE